MGKIWINIAKKYLKRFCFLLFLILLITGLSRTLSSENELDIILDNIFLKQEMMVKEISDAIFETKYHYLETRANGKIEKSISALRKVYMKEFEKQKHEFLEMTLNNRKLNPAEMEKNINEWRKQEKMIKNTKMPFDLRFRKYYNYYLSKADSSYMSDVWKIEFKPKRKRAGYVQGFVYISKQDTNIVQLHFIPIRLPFVLRNFQIIINYSNQNSFWLPGNFSMETDVIVKIIITLYHRHISIKEEYSNYQFNNGLNDDFFE
jgi:hypothetical protein